jgi:hypothetical protein
MHPCVDREHIEETEPPMDATRRRRTRDPIRKHWYAIWRRWRFARHLGFVEIRPRTASAMTFDVTIAITHFHGFDRVLKLEGQHVTDWVEVRQSASDGRLRSAKRSRCPAASDARPPLGPRTPVGHHVSL